MQPQPKNDLVYLLTILESIGKIEIYSSGFADATLFHLANDQLNFNASLLLIATIGDQIAKISTDTKAKYAAVPWLKIKDTRNRIVHDYAGIDFDITYHIIKKEIPALRLSIEGLVKKELLSEILSIEELEIGRNSTWYKHVDFDALT